jgi:hypothetical protein
VVLDEIKEEYMKLAPQPDSESGLTNCEQYFKDVDELMSAKMDEAAEIRHQEQQLIKIQEDRISKGRCLLASMREKLHQLDEITEQK